MLYLHTKDNDIRNEGLQYLGEMLKVNSTLTLLNVFGEKRRIQILFFFLIDDFFLNRESD